MFAVDQYYYNGKLYDCMGRAKRISEKLSMGCEADRLEMVILSANASMSDATARGLDDGLVGTLHTHHRSKLTFH